MTACNTWFWSCKMKRPDTLQRHKTFEAAASRAGDCGFVYAESDQTVKQIFRMSNNALNGIDVDKNPLDCETCGFDMRQMLRSLNIIE